MNFLRTCQNKTLCLFCGTCIFGVALLSKYVSFSISSSVRHNKTNRVEIMEALNPSNIGASTKDNFREWFDLRPRTNSFVSSEPHTYMVDVLISNDICKDKDIDLLVYFHSAVDNFDRRQILRETWASTNMFLDISVRVMFLVGVTSDAEYQMWIRNENMVYRDLIQADIKESYLNLRYKALVALMWINNNCAHARYILKADDDIFVDIFKVVENVLPQLYTKNQTVFCHYKKEGFHEISRDPKNQWYVPSVILPERKTFPGFCSGYAVVMTTDIIPHLYKASFHAPPFPIDDVYMFGILPMVSGNFTLRYIDASSNFTPSISNREQKNSYLVSGVPKLEQYQELWTRTLSSLSGWAKQHATIAGFKTNTTGIP